MARSVKSASIALSVVGFLLAICAFAPASAEAVVARDQRDLAETRRAIERGDFDFAIRTLSALAAETDAAPIRLELARAYFLAGEYLRAREQFLKVYRLDIPYPVRRTINLYLDQIDRRVGYFRPRLGFVADNNPTQQPPNGAYEILGIPLQFKADSRTRFGLTYAADGLIPVLGTGPTTWQLVGEVDGIAYQNRSDANRVSAGVGLRHDNQTTDTRVTAGWRGFETHALRSNAPFVEYFRRWTPRPDRQVSIQASVELNRFPGRDDLRGETARAAVVYVRDLGADVTGQLALGAARSTIDDTVLARNEVFVRAAAARSLPSMKLNLIVAATTSRSQYGLSDPFFGRLRQDHGLRLDVSLYSARPWLGFFPGVVLSGEERWSNIGFYQYRKAGMSIDIRRRF